MSPTARLEALHLSSSSFENRASIMHSGEHQAGPPARTAVNMSEASTGERREFAREILGREPNHGGSDCTPRRSSSKWRMGPQLQETMACLSFPPTSFAAMASTKSRLEIGTAEWWLPKNSISNRFLRGQHAPRGRMPPARTVSNPRKDVGGRVPRPRRRRSRLLAACLVLTSYLPISVSSTRLLQQAGQKKTNA